jgi:hypothetical protein
MQANKLCKVHGRSSSHIKVQHTNAANRYELPLNHSSLISMILLPLWHELSNANCPLVAELEVEDEWLMRIKLRRRHMSWIH